MFLTKEVTNKNLPGYLRTFPSSRYEILSIVPIETAVIHGTIHRVCTWMVILRSSFNDEAVQGVLDLDSRRGLDDEQKAMLKANLPRPGEFK